MAPYFAFASNLSRAVMHGSCPAAQPLEPAYLADHRLAFAGHSEAWGGATALSVLAPGERQWGALYEVDEACLDTLAKREGAAYTLSRTHCLKADGTRAIAYLFVKVHSLKEAAPSDRYVAAIRQGYEEWGLDVSALDRAVDRAAAAGIDSGR